jgi:hypothetical protein
MSNKKSKQIRQYVKALGLLPSAVQDYKKAYKRCDRIGKEAVGKVMKWRINMARVQKAHEDRAEKGSYASSV